MEPLIFESGSPEETEALGEALGRALRAGDFIGLVGDLGAGKTRLARGIARGAGVADDAVSSPTFAIVQTYRGRLPLHHADLYRLGDADELHATGFFDLQESEGAMMVEWLDRVPEAAPRDRLLLTLTPIDENRRWIQATGTGERSGALLAAWARAASGR